MDEKKIQEIEVPDDDKSLPITLGHQEIPANFDEHIKNAMRLILDKYGGEIINDAKRFESLLKDFCGDRKREIFMLVTCLQYNVPLEIARMIEPRELSLRRTCANLSAQTGFSEKDSMSLCKLWESVLVE